MEVDEGEDRLVLEISSDLLKQNLSREMHKLFGFAAFVIDFELGDSEFEITRLHKATPACKPQTEIPITKFEEVEGRLKES